MAEMGTDSAEMPLPTPAVTNNPPENTIHDEAWKHRAPYHKVSHERFGPVKWRAHCQCRKISYVIRQDRPLNAKFCHCRGCQVMHGAPFQWAAIFHKEDVSFVNGSSGLSFYSSSLNTQKYHTPTKVSCSFCHTLIMDEGRNTCLLFPQLIEFAGSPEEKKNQRNLFKPTCHIFYEQRVMDIPDGIPKWSAMNDDSDRLDDRGNKIDQ
ncbi:hypothetical protein N7532_007694 [Penicillium argentinense]|uniref:CENP-V/GFA domain-containing protein n=1 Tax=Penicillium argentinense TaxID=1131581 RepID=A0A9W9K160_9EURO|nr:uncharacterized protein N7532_007694 [Penicillium argentinense]KAJ5089010.1 hypothetical protein N7532_007694 [Penicillium argentinense]